MATDHSVSQKAEKGLTIFLALNGIILALLGVLCAVAPVETSEMIGLRLIGAKGIAEYTSVYGGIEFGLGLFFCLGIYRKDFRYPGLMLSLLMYGSIVVYRGAAMVIHGPTSDVGWFLYSLEVSCFIASIILLKLLTPQRPSAGGTGGAATR